MEKAGRYNPMTNLAMESEAAVAAVENVNSILESNSDLISKLNQQNSTIVKVNAKEVERIRKMFTDLSNLETGGIDPAQLNELLTATEEGFTFNVQGQRCKKNESSTIEIGMNIKILAQDENGELAKNKKFYISYSDGSNKSYSSNDKGEIELKDMIPGIILNISEDQNNETGLVSKGGQ